MIGWWTVWIIHLMYKLQSLLTDRGGRRRRTFGSQAFKDISLCCKMLFLSERIGQRGRERPWKRCIIKTVMCHVWLIDWFLILHKSFPFLQTQLLTIKAERMDRNVGEVHIVCNLADFFFYGIYSQPQIYGLENNEKKNITCSECDFGLKHTNILISSTFFSAKYGS